MKAVLLSSALVASTASFVETATCYNNTQCQGTVTDCPQQLDFGCMPDDTNKSVQFSCNSTGGLGLIHFSDNDCNTVLTRQALGGSCNAGEFGDISKINERETKRENKKKKK